MKKKNQLEVLEPIWKNYWDKNPQFPDSLWRRANEGLTKGWLNSLRWPIYAINLVDNTKSTRDKNP